MGLKEEVMNRKYRTLKKLWLICELNKPIAYPKRQWRLLSEEEDILDELIDKQDIKMDAMAVPPPISYGDTTNRGPREWTRRGSPGVHYCGETS